MASQSQVLGAGGRLGLVQGGECLASALVMGTGGPGL